MNCCEIGLHKHKRKGVSRAPRPPPLPAPHTRFSWFGLDFSFVWPLMTPVSAKILGYPSLFFFSFYKPLYWRLTFNRSQQGSCSATYETPTQKQVYHWLLKGGESGYCQDPGTVFCNCIIVHNCLELDYLSNSITHDYFLLLPYKLDKALISVRSAIGNDLSFSGPHTVLKQNFNVSESTRPSAVCLTLVLQSLLFDQTSPSCSKQGIQWINIHKNRSAAHWQSHVEKAGCSLPGFSRPGLQQPLMQVHSQESCLLRVPCRWSRAAWAGTEALVWQASLWTSVDLVSCLPLSLPHLYWWARCLGL